METAKINIREIRRRGRTAFRANFLLCVFAALMMALVVEGSTTIFSGNSGYRFPEPAVDSTETEETVEDTFSYIDENGEEIIYTREEMEDLYVKMQYVQQVLMFVSGHLDGCLGMLLTTLVVSGMGVFGILIAFFISNVVEVGCCKFYLVNAKRKAYINEVFSFFKKGKYRRTMMIQLYRVSYIFCWSLLLIVPGVIKAYEYRLVPYLLADGVEVKLDETLQMSKNLMKGHKMEAFLLDLSFLGWDLIGALSFGLVATFYANPYKYASRAEFYAEVRRLGDPAYVRTEGSRSNYNRDGKDPFAGYRAYQKKDK